MSQNSIYSVIILGLLGLGCETPATEKGAAGAYPEEPVQQAEVQPATVLPATFSTTFDPDKRPKSIAVPANLINVGKVVSKRAALREGPGIQFELFDEILPLNTEVLIFDKLGVWQKVIVMGSWQAGWLHEKMLARSKLRQTSVNLEVRRLPTVFAMTQIEKAMTYPEGKEVAVSIPKGAIFKTIKLEGRRSLVWLAQTNSVMWLHQEKVQ